jgi:hypothetical protein
MNAPAESAKNSVKIGNKNIVEQQLRIARQRELMTKLERQRIRMSSPTPDGRSPRWSKCSFKWRSTIPGPRGSRLRSFNGRVKPNYLIFIGWLYSTQGRNPLPRSHASFYAPRRHRRTTERYITAKAASNTPPTMKIKVVTNGPFSSAEA